MDHPECPEELTYLWEWFIQVFSGNNLTFSELDAWARLMRISFEPWEVEELMRLNTIFWRVHNGR